MSEIYKKFCNSMDAYPPNAAFTTGVIGAIIFVMSFIMRTFSFIPTAVLSNISTAFAIIGLLLIAVPVFRLGIYPMFKTFI